MGRGTVGWIVRFTGPTCQGENVLQEAFVHHGRVEAVDDQARALLRRLAVLRSERGLAEPDRRSLSPPLS
jgi:hypothetical protein